MLAGTVTGLIGAAGAAVALNSVAATPAEAAAGSATPDWINVTDSPYDADPTGTTDASSAINSAIAASPAGGVVYLPTGIFLIAGPIVLQKSVTLLGDHGATSSGDDASEFSGTIIRVASTFTNPAWSDFATAAILCLDQSPGTNGSASTLGIRLRDFWIDGSNGPANVDGITCYGPVSAWQAERIGVYKATGNGFSFQQADGASPDGQHLYSCLAQTCGGEGFTGQLVDATLADCHAQACKTNGIHLTGGNTRFIGCRSDLNGEHGWYLDHSGARDGYSDGIILEGCGTQRNNNNGVFITNSSGTSWHDPILITGCSIGEDGQNGTWSEGTISGGDGQGWAGIHIEGENDVHISNTLIAVGTKDVSTGCPQFGIQTAETGGGVPLSITVSGGRVEASTSLINDAASVEGNFRISPETVGALGYQSTTIISRQGSATLQSGTVTVTNAWVSSTSRVFLSTIQTSSPGFLSVSRSTGSFKINSTSSSDASTVAWMLTTA
jgi:Pectate lyase superfamily protein